MLILISIKLIILIHLNFLINNLFFNLIFNFNILFSNYNLNQVNYINLFKLYDK